MARTWSLARTFFLGGRAVYLVLWLLDAERQADRYSGKASGITTIDTATMSTVRGRPRRAKSPKR
jgi:hypothetical protein